MTYKKWEFGTIVKIFTEMTDNINIQTLCYKTQISYATVRKNIYELGKMGIIKTEDEGRMTRIIMTETGKKMSILFKQIHNILEEAKICSEEGKNSSLKKNSGD